MKYDLILFDMDGTLVDSQVGIMKSIMYALECFGIENVDRSRLRGLIGMDLRSACRSLGDFSEAQIEDMVAKYRERLTEKGLYEGKVYDGIATLLDSLRQSGVRMAVATAKATVFAERGLEYFGIAKYFDLIIGCELDGERSDKGEIIAHILDELDPERTLSVAMVGDREYDILGAKAHGLDSFGCLWGYGSEAELTEAGATFIVKSPQEILDYV